MVQATIDRKLSVNDHSKSNERDHQAEESRLPSADNERRWEASPAHRNFWADDPHEPYEEETDAPYVNEMLVDPAHSLRRLTEDALSCTKQR